MNRPDIVYCSRCGRVTDDYAYDAETGQHIECRDCATGEAPFIELDVADEMDCT